MTLPIIVHKLPITIICSVTRDPVHGSSRNGPFALRLCWLNINLPPVQRDTVNLSSLEFFPSQSSTERNSAPEWENVDANFFFPVGRRAPHFFTQVARVHNMIPGHIRWRLGTHIFGHEAERLYPSLVVERTRGDCAVVCSAIASCS